MADKDFDKNLRELLQDTKMDYDPSSWSAMDKKLNNEFSSLPSDSELEKNDAFDELLKSKLSNASENYDPTSWGDLSEKIEKDEVLRGRILRLGIIQCIAALLLLLSLWNWKGAEIIEDKKIAQQEETDIQFAFIQMHENFYAQFIRDISSDRISLEYLTYPIIELEKILFRSSGSEDDSKLSSTTKASRVIATNILALGSKLDVISNDIIPNSITKSSNSISSIKEDTRDDLLTYNLLPRKEQFIKNRMEHILTHDQNALINFPEQKEDRVEKGITAVFSPDLYLIRSSDDPIYPLPSYFTDSYGLTGGALFALKSNSIELETGLLYSSVSYRPRQITEQYSSRGQYFETTLNDIFFNVISIPFQFKWHFDIGANSSFYALAGSSFNMVINSNFNINNIPIATPLNELADLKANKPLLEEKDFEPGIFEGGDIFDNAFITADLGFGFQQRVAGRLSLFFQPTLSTQFSSGIGPNQDKLHRASLFLGAKYHLN